MSFCDNSIISINLDECVGNSLVTINTNFNLVKEKNCEVDVELNQYENTLNVFDTRFNSLTSQLLGLPKCAVKFNKDTDIIFGFKINSVTKNSVGSFRIFFDLPFNTIDYVVIGTAAKYDTPCFLSVLNQTISYTDVNIRGSSGTLIDPDYINIIFYY